MVVISTNKKFVFIHIPKTCGMTIKNSIEYDIKLKCQKIDYLPIIGKCMELFQIKNKYHLTYKETLELYPEIKDYYIFTFVRNPYDRLYSTFQYHKKHLIKTSILIYLALYISVYILSKKIFNNEILNNILLNIMLILLSKKIVAFSNFKLYIKEYFFINSKIAYYTIMPQYKYIEGVKPDFIGREETFDKDFDFIRTKFNIKKDIKNTNIITEKDYNSQYKYIKFYDKEMIQFVNNYYRKDFETFNYKMINI